MAPADVFARLAWKQGRMFLNDLVFEVPDGEKQREPGGPGFPLLKPKRMLDQYAQLWRLRADFRPQHILELGIYRGGSLVFWFEVFQPARLVALDIAEMGDSPLFQQYVAARGLQGRVATHWRTSQADAPRLTEIIARDFPGPVDLVIDDASHLYPFTKGSFETLFPRLRPGGLYIIEDWSWDCWPGLAANYNPSMATRPAGLTRAASALPRLVGGIVLAAGEMADFLVESDGILALKPLIANVHVYPDFVVIERGEADVATFNLDRERPGPPEGRLRRAIKRIAGLGPA